MLIAVTGNHASKDKPMRERMPAAGYEPANIGYNEMPALIPFPQPGVETLRTVRHEEN